LRFDLVAIGLVAFALPFLAFENWYVVDLEHIYDILSIILHAFLKLHSSGL
jgi:hypothetical protein